MSLIDVVITSLVALRGNFLRTLLTMLGIIIGIASVIALTAAGAGAQQGLDLLAKVFVDPGAGDGATPPAEPAACPRRTRPGTGSRRSHGRGTARCRHGRLEHGPRPAAGHHPARATGRDRAGLTTRPSPPVTGTTRTSKGYFRQDGTIEVIRQGAVAL